jgi:hypothetical protein
MLHRPVYVCSVVLRFVLAGWIALMLPQQTLTACSGQREISPCYHKELDSLDFLLGDWNIGVNMRLEDGKWEQSSATSQIKRDLSGCLLSERFTGSREGRTFNALGMMGFNSVSGKLQRMWSDSEHGILILYEGKRDEKEMLLDTEILLNGNRVKLRNGYLGITKDSFTLESRRSHDDGKTWITVSRLQYRRR